MKAIDFLNEDMDKPDRKFKLKGGRVIWEAIGIGRRGVAIVISRVCDTGGRPFMMGLRYKRKYISPDTELEVLNPEDIKE